MNFDPYTQCVEYTIYFHCTVTVTVQYTYPTLEANMLEEYLEASHATV